MNKKRIDQIIQAAFEGGDLGHLSAAERIELAKMKALGKGLEALRAVPDHQLSNERLRAALMASMTPAQRQEFAASQKIAEGLEALKAVPDHQLSNERLKDAILATAPPRRSYGWSYATATLACVALAFIAIRSLGPGDEAPGPQSEPTVAAGADSSSSLDSGQSVVKRQVVVEEPEEPVVSTRREDRSRVASVAAVGPDYHDLIDPANFDEIVRTISFDIGEEAADVAPAGAEAPAPAADREPLVVVDSASTTPNGAARATELSSYGNVVFGG